MSKTKILSLIGFIVLQIGCSEKNQITEPNTSQDKPVEVVVEQKPKVSTTEPKNSEPKLPKISIHEAARRGDLDTIKKFVEEGGDLNEIESIFGTPLHNAIAYGQFEAVKLLVEEGADVNQKNPSDGGSTVMSAVFNSFPEILKYLLENNANRNTTDKKGMSALNLLGIPWQEMTVVYMIVESVIRSQEPSPEFPAFDMNRIKINLPEIYSLLTDGKDFESFQKNNTIYLAIAVKNNDVETIKKAIEDGVDLDKKNKDGNTLLIGASLSENSEMVKTLIDGGANLDIQNNNRDTALMSAAFFCNKEVVKLLLDAGADKSLRNASGSTVTEFMSAPWNDEMEGLYKFIGGLLQMDLDLEMIEKERPVIAEMLQ